MNIKANFSELTEVSNKMQTNADNLDDEIEKALESIESLKKIWQGEDAETFYDSATTYFTQMKVLPSTMKILGKFVDNSSSKYRDNDDGFRKEISKEKENLIPETVEVQTLGSEIH